MGAGKFTTNPFGRLSGTPFHCINSPISSRSRSTAELLSRRAFASSSHVIVKRSQNTLYAGCPALLAKTQCVHRWRHGAAPVPARIQRLPR